jgi:ATP-binding protein involved in chromosome partitioning
VAVWFKLAPVYQGERMSITIEAVKAALAQVIDPNTGKDLIATKSAKNIQIDGANVSLDVELGYPAKSQLELIKQLVVSALQALPGVGTVTARVDFKIIAHAVQRGVKLKSNVKNIIAVASGKGGVGKSTTAVNLALALSAEGARVGILDADIYGPSQPMMMGISGKPETKDGKSMEPLENHGLQVSSIGFMIDPDEPMVWRGPIVTQALQQLLDQTNWRDLDYLVIDMPPGTGDVQLTLSQKVPVTGAVIVTTPQDIALLDARKGLKMFDKVGIPILGIVENMSIHICSNCNHAEPIFGAGGGEKMCADFNVDFLGALPLTMSIREQTDAGRPTVIADPDGQVAQIYKDIARKVAVKVAEKAKDMTSKFPSIVIQND